LKYLNNTNKNFSALHCLSSDFLPDLFDITTQGCNAIIRPCQTGLAALSIPGNVLDEFSEVIALYFDGQSGVTTYQQFLDDLNTHLKINIDIRVLDSDISNWMRNDTKFKEYNSIWSKMTHEPNDGPKSIVQSKSPVQSKSFARIGFMGNPSDGFYGYF
jgi:hypothetical protein